MAYDYAKLNGRITEKCGSQGIFAKQMNLSERTVSQKLNNKIAWKQSEIQRAIVILGLTVEEIPLYFFTIKVQSN